ncbi:MAG: hypothetical protein H0W14_06180, partial [Actinobacteria bacterium]|nr:hypothetical protein [Actinomycetota bacterium]
MARNPQEPQAQGDPGAVSGRQDQALLPAGHRAPRPALPAEARLLSASIRPVGEIYLTRAEIARRVGELGRELADAYAGRNPLLVAPLKSSIVFLADLSRALPVSHQVDFLELAAYTGAGSGSGVRLLKDLDASVVGRDVLIVEDVVDTGMTLNFLARTLLPRQPASLAAVTLLDR